MLCRQSIDGAVRELEARKNFPVSFITVQISTQSPKNASVHDLDSPSLSMFPPTENASTDARRKFDSARPMQVASSNQSGKVVVVVVLAT
jgi:hypothetical protein